MKARDTLRLAIKAMHTGKLRSLLTLAGLSIGSGALIAVLSLGWGGRGMISNEMSKLGVNRIWVTPTVNSGTQLDIDDAELIRRSERGVFVSASKTAYQPVVNGRREATLKITGCESDYFKVAGLEAKSGRTFGERKNEAVLDEAVETELFGLESGLGKEIEISGRAFTVCGIIKSKQSAFSDKKLSGVIYIPLTSLCGILGDYSPDDITLCAPSDTQAVAKRVINTLARLKGGSFTAVTLANEAETAERVLGIFIAVLGAVAVICMAVGGIGIMNVMLSAVMQRRAQIGIMMAIGAEQGDIYAQFLAECAIYSLLGAAAGTLVGALLTLAGSVYIGMDFYIPAWAIALSVALSAASGMFFGVFPAKKAAAISPMEAIRGSA